MINNIYDVLIIGGGPAGLTAGIYSSRNGMKTIIIEKGAPGGKLNNTHKVDNYPGMKGKAGFELSISFMEQAKKFGSELINNEVIDILDQNEKIKRVILKNGKIIETKTIIIATGMKAKRLEVEGYDKYFGKGVGVCVVCDAPFYKGKNIAIIGGGNSATEESIFAAGIVNKVYVINSFETFKSEKITLNKLNELKNVELISNTEVISINGNENKINSLTVLNKKLNTKYKIEVDGVFTYIGWDPESIFLINKGILSKNNFINVDPETCETGIKGVFAAGDILNKKFKQITTATSEGTKAALAAQEYLR